MTINLPLQAALEVSPCHTGAGRVSDCLGRGSSMLTCRCVDTISNSGDDSTWQISRVLRLKCQYIPASDHLPKTKSAKL